MRAQTVHTWGAGKKGWIRVVESADLTATQISCVAVNPAGTLVAFGPNIKLFKRTSPNAPLTPVNNASPALAVSNLTFDRTGEFLFGSVGTDLYWWRVNADCSLAEMPAPAVHPGNTVYSLNCSPTADLIHAAVAKISGSAYSWTPQTLSGPLKFSTSTGAGKYGAWSSDGTRLVYGTTDKRQLVALSVSENTFTPISVNGTASALSQICSISNDGNIIISVKNNCITKAAYSSGAYEVDVTPYNFSGLGSMTSPSRGFYKSPDEKHYLFLSNVAPYAAAGALNDLTPADPEELTDNIKSDPIRGVFTPDSKNMFILTNAAPYIHNFYWKG